MWHGEFRHPRLVQVYDAQFGWSREDEFFLAVVEQTPRVRVVDLGCGTGRLTVALAAAGHQVVGVDPASASLQAARARPGADRVTWVHGTSEVLPDAAFDVAVMTAHVAQFLVNDDDWHGTLRDLRRALVPGGRLLFDTRDPRARLWERWNERESRRQVALPDGTRVDVWTDVTGADGDCIALAMHHRFPDEHLVGEAAMRFRDEETVRRDLAGAGFTVEQMYGGWQREPVGSADGELLVLAVATA